MKQRSSLQTAPLRRRLADCGNEVALKPQVMHGGRIAEADPGQVASVYIVQNRPADDSVVVQPAFDQKVLRHRYHAGIPCLDVKAVRYSLSVRSEIHGEGAEAVHVRAPDDAAGLVTHRNGLARDTGDQSPTRHRR